MHYSFHLSIFAAGGLFQCRFPTDVWVNYISPGSMVMLRIYDELRSVHGTVTTYIIITIAEFTSD